MCLDSLSYEAREIDVLHGVMILHRKYLLPVCRKAMPIDMAGWQYARKELLSVRRGYDRYYSGFHLYESLEDAIAYGHKTANGDFLVITHEVQDIIVQGIDCRKHVTVVGARKPLWIAYDSRKDRR